ncbi:MAG: DUF2630 family protein, partial [Arthrobacter sp.]|uniref:DUF2630 family protein n=1 Tax=Arthrobacter sp. TaxID=1667 RepID=UPI00348476E5
QDTTTGQKQGADMGDQDLLEHLEDLISEEKWLRQQAIERACGADTTPEDHDGARRLGEVSAQLDRCLEALVRRAISLDAGAGERTAGTPRPGVLADREPLEAQA